MLKIPKTYYHEIMIRIQNLATNKKILDVGVVGNIKTPCKRHLVYTEFAKSKIGVDIDKEKIDYAISKGIDNIFHFNICSKKDTQKIIDRFGLFDLVICSELIEHLGDSRSFFINILSLLNDKGKVIITTPNSRCLTNIINLIKSNNMVVAPDHVAWYDEKTVTQLLDQCGFKILELDFYGEPLLEWLDEFGLTEKVKWMYDTLFIIATKKGE